MTTNAIRNPGSTGDIKTKVEEGAKDLAHQAAHKVGEVKGKVEEGAKDFAHQASQKAGEIRSKVEEGAKDFAHQAGQTAEQAAVAAGRGMQNFSETIREHAPQGGMWGSAAKTVSDRIESGGRYLEQEKFSGVMDDLSEVARRNPVPTLLLAVGVGFLLATAMSRR